MDTFPFNQDVQRRNELLNLDIDWEKRENRIIRFDPVNIDTLHQLILEKFIDPDSSQNSSPTVKEIYSFIQKYPVVLAFGYAVTPKRRDYRISIEGIIVNKEHVNEDLKNAFIDFCKNADELGQNGNLMGWWD